MSEIACPSFQVGDLVMFAKRTQVTSGGMRVQEVEEGLFGTRIKVDYKWWHPKGFISFQEWKEKIDKQ